MKKFTLPRLYRHFRSQGIDVVGPLVPDAAFLKVNWDKYSLFVSPYHDQGLIPFKMIHGQDAGVHLTLGLPFVRTKCRSWYRKRYLW